MSWLIQLFSKDKESSKDKYVKLFSVEHSTCDSLLFPRNTLYYESLYGITPKGKTKFIRNTMEYFSKGEAKHEKELIMEVLSKRYSIQ